MNGVDNIIADIRKESENRAAEIIAQAREKQSEAIKSLTAEAKSDGETAVHEAQKRAFEMINRAQSMSELESRKKLLAAKRAIIAEVFDRVRLSFSSMDGSTYMKFLVSAAKSVGSGILTFSNHDKQYAQGVMSSLGQGYTISNSFTDAIESGFIIKNGAVETNCSVQAIIEEHRRELEPIIAKILFNDEKK